jgi:hypothetical protein
MANQAERFSMDLDGLFTHQQVANLTHIARQIVMKENVDIRITISFSEAPEHGGYFPRPHSVGGPGVLVSLSVPAENKLILECFVAELRCLQLI